MKKVVRFSGWALGLTLLGLCSALGFRLAEQDRLPDFDKRNLALSVVDGMNADQQSAVSRLQSKSPGLQVTVDSKIGTPKFVRNPHGFLTGPDGQGVTVSPEAAAAFDADDPVRPVKAFLSDYSDLFGHGPEVLEDALVKRQFVTAHNGLTTVVWQQQVDDVSVYSSVLISHITKKGQLVNISSQFIPDPSKAATLGNPNKAALLAEPSFSAAQAVIAAASQVGEVVRTEDLEPGGASKGPALVQGFSAPGLTGSSDVRLVWLPYSRNVLRLTWQVTLTSAARGEMFLVLVDAETGDPILRRCLTEYISDATYNVWTSDSPSPFSPGHQTPNTGQPGLIPRTSVVTSAFNTNASPNGWINDGDNETLGNNVDAHTDTDANNQPDLPRPVGNPMRVFDFPIDLTMDPNTYSDGAVVDLFYWNNVIHDRLWELGFTEAAGNFQTDNFGRGGLGNDAVQADAQDGSGFNNANFSTPPDGQPGRMQMFLFDGPTPDRDGDFDHEVVIHEYVHGLSNRRVGNGVGISTLQPRGMGEGWSDFYGLAMLSESTDDVHAAYAMGGYVTFEFSGLMENYYYGIRRYPYSTDLTKNPLTFKDIDPAQADPHLGVPRSPVIGNQANQVHNMGQVWCTALWEARANVIDKFGFATGNELILQLVTDGMNLSPPNPNFLEARDAIIQADLINNGGANFDELWAAFAKRGMGGSASSPSSTTTSGVEEAFDLPGLALSTALATDPSGNGNGSIDFNECIDLNVVLINNGRILATEVTTTLTTTNPLVTISQGISTYPDVPAGATATNDVPFKFYTAPGFKCGDPITFEMQVVSAQDARVVRVTLETGLIGAANRYDNNTPLPIPDADPRGVSSPVTVSGFAGDLARVTVSLHITHTFDFDLNIRLVAPDGTAVALSEQNGFFGVNFGVACSPDTQRTTFDDKATIPIAAANPPYVGTFRPDEPLAILKGKGGQAVNGVWRLEVADIFTQDVGTLECWSLNLSPIICSDGGGDCSTDLAVIKTASPGPNVVGSNLTYSITVSNLGPNTGRNVMVTDPLPSNVNFISALTSQGVCGEAGGIVSCNLGTIVQDGSATVSIVVQPTMLGSLTNSASVNSTVTDPFPINNFSTVVVEIVPPTPVLVPAGTFLVSESLAPANGGLDVGEDVTIQFNLRNVGSLDTTNLLVKLQSSGGVVNPSSQQSYGVIEVGGPPVGREFSFQVAGTNGGAVIATLQLQDGTNDLGSLEYTYALGSQFLLVNQSVINVPDQGAAGLYPSPIFVAGLLGVVDHVELTLSNVSHTFPSDLDILLVSPSGRSVMVMSDAGGGSSINNVNLFLDDEAPSPIPSSSLIQSGSYQPSDYETGDIMPDPAPAGPYTSELAGLFGTDPNGTWLLYVSDDTAGDLGRIAGGWHLHLTTVDPVNPEADLAVEVVGDQETIQAGQEMTFTITVTNAGPEEAFETMVTSQLPPATLFVSAMSSVGSCDFDGDREVACDLGSLAQGDDAVITLVLSPTLGGTLELSSSVTAQVVDFDLDNNVDSAFTEVTAAADIALTMSQPASVVNIDEDLTINLTVTNQGPNTALALFVTNNLPAGVTFVSADSSLGTCQEVNGIVTCSLGLVPSGGGATIDVVFTPTMVASLTNRATAKALVPADPDSTNNTVVNSFSAVHPDFLMQTAGTRLVAESFTPPSGGIEVNETVEVDLGLRNSGTSDTVNLTATLLNTGGVMDSSGSQNYGVVVAGGPPVERRFSFTASGSGGSMLTAILQLQDGATDLGTIQYTFSIGTVTSFSNPDSIFIPDIGKAGTYPSIITVSNLSGLVSKAEVSLFGVTHSYPDDLDLLLVSPSGQSALLMSDVGGGTGVSDATFTLDDNAASYLPDINPLVSGSYRPTNFEANDIFPAPAPTGARGNSLQVFVNSAAEGDWALYVVDDSVGDLGDITGGWELSLTTYGPVTSLPALLSEPIYLPDGSFQFTIDGPVGATYQIEGSLDMESWSIIGNTTLTNTSQIYIDGSASGQIQRFYRALLLQ